MKIEKFSDQPIITNVSRRNLLKGIVGTGGLILAAQFLPRSALADGGSVNAYKTGADGMPGGVVWDPHVFVSIAPDGTVTIVTHRSEMGTGSRTSLPMVVADEMEADWARVAGVTEQGGATMMVAAGVRHDFMACYAQVQKTDNGELLIDPMAMEMLNIGPGDRVLAVSR